MSKFQYPDLAEALETLNQRLENISEEHAPLIEKWLEQLGKINKQMRHLERIESFSNALKKDDKND